MCEIGSGVVKRLVRNFGGPLPPATLSATGAFSNLAALTPHPGIVPYAVNHPLWSDYAAKSRWFSIPSLSARMNFLPEGTWGFPNGQIWIKHFEIEMTRGNPATSRRLETRFIIKNSAGVYGLTYKWRTDHSDADLVGEGGLDENLTIDVNGTPTTQTWRYPSRSECMTCHTAGSGSVLGFNTRQMNLVHPYGAQQQNQIAALASAGYFNDAPNHIATLPAHPRLEDQSISREARVRAYLAVNCGQCHLPGGSGEGNWDGRITTPTDLASIIDGTLVNNGGNTANRFVVPGNISRSVALHRLQGTGGFTRMPPLGSNAVHPAAVQLLQEWITLDLPSRRNIAQWQTEHFGSPTAPNAALTADPDQDAQSNALEFLNNTSPTVASPPNSVVPQNHDGTFQLSFTHPANRSVLVETSSDLVNWSLWNVPGNTPIFPAAPVMRTLEGPMDLPSRTFRLRIGEP